MFGRIKDQLEKRRAQSLVDSLQYWHFTCEIVSQICGDALHDEALIRADIGTVLDSVDRKLFQFRNDANDAHRNVKRHDPELARQVRLVTHQVYQLRNQTARFLIRAQGPRPALGKVSQVELLDAYYLKALEESGFEARRLKSDLDAELNALWPALEQLIHQAQSELQDESG